jgi:hypothetical protein
LDVRALNWVSWILGRWEAAFFLFSNVLPKFLKFENWKVLTKVQNQVRNQLFFSFQ